MPPLSFQLTPYSAAHLESRGMKGKHFFFPGASWFVSASGIGRFQVALHCWSEEWKEKKSARTLKIFTAEVPRKVDVEGVA